MNIEELEIGDILQVHTRNSVYNLKKLEKYLFEASGGVYDIRGTSPAKVYINGSTINFQGSIIKQNIIELGLYLELSNQYNRQMCTCTTKIQKIEYWRNKE
jgi:hypothetical protein